MARLTNAERETLAKRQTGVMVKAITRATLAAMVAAVWVVMSRGDPRYLLAIFALWCVVWFRSLGQYERDAKATSALD